MLDARAREMLGGCEGPSPVLVGAIPFDSDGRELIYEPRAITRLPRPAAAPDAANVAAPAYRSDSAEDARSARDYAEMVRAALGLIATGSGDEALRKVVLSRKLSFEAPAPPDREGLLASLANDPGITAYRIDLDPAGDGDGPVLIGATPELLASRKGLTVASEPLAGSIPRGRDPVQDRARGQSLLASEKDRREHAITVEYVLDTLAPHCDDLRRPGGMGLRSTATMWHLGTRIEGRLKSADGPSALGLAALLHPTPAVGGYPRDAALAAIARLEAHDRGFYSGAVGHVDAAGDGEWHVALRCAEVRGPQITLHAGAGIVAGSVPDDEVHETAAKFRAMLRAFGIPDAPRALREAS